MSPPTFNTNLAFQPRGGHDGQADVCWVCQDVPTQIYLMALNYDLQTKMLTAGVQYQPNVTGISNPEASLSRSVPSVQQALASYGLGYHHDGIPSNSSYRVGEMVFLIEPNWQLGAYHVGIVVRSCSNACTFDEALDQVLIAQTSSSSQGFYSNISTSSTDLAPEKTKGRFEIITLRTFLRKAVIGQDRTTDAQDYFNNLDLFANTFTAYGAPNW